MKLFILIIATLVLTGCARSSINTEPRGYVPGPSYAVAQGAFTPTTIQTSRGPVILVPNYSTGGTAAIIRPGRSRR